jgi:hypothetical protein
LIYAGGRSAAAAVAFANPGDRTLLGAHGLEGLNLRVVDHMPLDLKRRTVILPLVSFYHRFLAPMATKKPANVRDVAG